MSVFAFVILVIILTGLGKPIAQALANRLERQRGVGGGAEILELRSALRSTEERLGHAEDRIADMDEKLRFVEGLLAQPNRAGELPGAGTVPPQA
ncbi:MAG: hypothetical protein KY464_06480 [Gemmatimonadetes bacterium]|nr:hypothetical protein [Gemmatimonadota bacterium]